jgi:Ion channel
MRGGKDRLIVPEAGGPPTQGPPWHRGEASSVTAGLVLENLALGLVLVCITVLAQLGLTFFVLGLFRRLAASTAARPSFSSTMTASALLVVAILAGHLVQINVWALAFYLLAFFGDFWSAQSFVGETYTTLGYGDLLLPPERRMLAGWLALTGLIMIGWSTALFAYLLAKYHETHGAVLGRRGDGHER